MTSSTSTPPGLVAAFWKYCDIAKRTEERQSHWNAKTKEVVFRRLFALSRDLKPLEAVMQDDGQNCDTVALGFSPMATRIVVREGGGTKVLHKMGAYLFYSQVFNGKVLIGVSYSFVEELQDVRPNKGIALLDPEEIDDEKILGHVKQFLEEITAAETEYSLSMAEHESRALFGFRPKQQLDQAG